MNKIENNASQQQKKPKHGDFWHQMGAIVLGTTISLIVTIAAAQILERHQRAKDRRLSALMVMSNIESTARNLEDGYAYLERADTVSAWLLNLPLEKIDSMDQNTLSNLMAEVLYIPLLALDKSAESIFSNDIATWKNMGNFHFIDNVGRCFSTMHIVEEDWTAFSKEMDDARDEILYHREQYPGNTLNSKLLQNIKIRQLLCNFHNRKCWLQYIIERLRYDNYVNMAAIGISEQELSEFIKMREKEIKLDKVEPDINYTPNINPDSITTIQMPY